MEHLPYQSLNTEKYLQKYCLQTPFHKINAQPKTGIIIVIPCYAEPDLEMTLQSLCIATPPICITEVLIIVNAAKNETGINKKQNQLNIETINNFKHSNSHLIFHCIDEQQLPPKKAGVGLARKIGMDTAVYMYSTIQKKGVIVCLDADCKVSSNYLIQIEKHFYSDYPKTNGAALYFEHPIKKGKFNRLNNGIIDYELHLRYYNLCIEYCGCPFAYHTVGSSMAVKSDAYQKQGGMNTRKAGEDFYFLHKIIELANFSRLNTVTVYPSPRISTRVPFGTGRAQEEYSKHEDELSTYNFSIFEEIKKFTSQFENFYHSEDYESLIPSEFVNQFLREENFETVLKEIKKNTRSADTFHQRLWKWMNAFKFMKLTHFLRDQKYPNSSISSQALLLLDAQKYKTNFTTNFDLLNQFRMIEKEKGAK